VARITEWQAFSPHRFGTACASDDGVQLPRTLLIVLSVTACAMRVHAPTVDLPGAVREVNSCLRIVRLAASRRSGSSGSRRRSTDALSAGL
jgi:hypothetical protein